MAQKPPCDDRRNERMSTRVKYVSAFCMAMYFTAMMFVSFALLPQDAFALMGGKPPDVPISITLAGTGICLTLGLMLHLVFYRMNPESFERKMFWKVGTAMLLLFVALFVSSFVLSRVTGLSPTVLSRQFNSALIWFGVAAMGLVVVCFAAILIGLRCQTSQRVARRIAAGDYDGAIHLGESCAMEKRDFATNFNLAMAYALSGDKGKAKHCLAEFEHMQEPPAGCTAEVFLQAIENLKQALEKNADDTRM